MTEIIVYLIIYSTASNLKGFIFNIIYMKQKILLITIVVIAAFKINAQNLTIENGALKFSSIDVYEKYAENTFDRNDINIATTNLITLSKLKEWITPTYSEGEEEIAMDTLYPDFLRTILNVDKIFAVDSFLIKMDLENNRALVINSTVTNAYTTLTSNDITNINVIVFDIDEDYALDVLNAIQKGTLTLSEYKNSNNAQRIKWPWNGCSGAPGINLHEVNTWEVSNDTTRCRGTQFVYSGINELKYQKFIFYFSLMASSLSKKGCRPGTREIHFADIRLRAAAKYIKVSHCQSEEYRGYNNTLISSRKHKWRAYEGSKALRSFTLYTTFGYSHDQTNFTEFTHQISR